MARFFHDSVSGLVGVGPLPMGPQAPEARTAYLHYLRHQLGGDPEQLRIWLERTLELDPLWVQGYLDLAGEYMSRGPEWAEKSAAAIERARALGADENNPWLLGAEGGEAFRLRHDLDAAEQIFRRATLIHPAFGAGYPNLMIVSGLTVEASAQLSVLTETLPMISDYWTFLAQARAINGDLEGAYQAALQYENLTPPHTYSLWQLPLYVLVVRTGRLEEARRRLEEVTAAMADGQVSGALPLFRGVLAFELAMSESDRETAVRIADELAAQGLGGAPYLRLGNPRANDQLAAAAPTADPAYVGIFLMVLTPDLREHPTVRTYLDSVGLTKAWRLELCRRAATLPPTTWISCDPAKYEQEGS